MARVYSKQMAYGNFAGGGAGYVYTCPAGVTAVVKNICVTPYAGPPTLLAVYLNGTTIFFSTAGGAAFISVEWSGMVVMVPGDRLFVQAAAGAWDYTISGYELGA